MSRGTAAIAIALLFSSAVAVSTFAQTQKPARFGFGRPATPDEIRALDIDVNPSGVGLPEGRGTVAEGAATYAAKCASCHGPAGENGKFDRLVGRDSGENFAFAKDAKVVKTIGSYWSYATTLFDYTARSMPFMQPGTLSANEVYGLVAYLHSQDPRRIYRLSRALQFGMVAVNRTKVTGAPIPFGGFKQSGLGREGARLGMEAFMEVKYVCRDWG